MKNKRKQFVVKSFLTTALMQFALALILCTASSANAYTLGLDSEDCFIPEGLAPKLSATARTTSVSFPTILLRGDNMLVVNAVKDTEFTIDVTHVQLGSYTYSPNWELRSQDNTLLDSGTLAFDQADTISYQHNKTEVLYLYMDIGSNSFYITESDVSLGLFAGAICKFLGNNTKNMYISVPEKVDNFTITLYSAGTSENVKVKVYDPTGTLSTSGETSTTVSTVDIDVTVGNYDDDVWKIEINTPSTGWLEDHAIKISADVPAILSLDEDDVFVYAPYGSQEKISLMVDKVMAASEGWEHEEWMIDAAKAVGFNTYVPRVIRGTATLDVIAGWCEDEDMKTFLWLRGTSAASLTDSTYDGKRYYPDGGEEPILSPSSDELWNTLTTAIEACATLSLTNPAIQGIFFDFEDYCSPHAYQHTYLISYDDVIIGKFETAESITVNATPPNRKAWLISNNYHDDFVEFQIDHWRDRCAQLRADIDVINPQFQFIVYPFGDTSSSRPPFLYGTDAPISELSTAQSPIILADYMTYPAPYTIIHDAEAEAPKIRSNLTRSSSYADDYNVPYMLLAGFDPFCLSNLEFLARGPIVGAEMGEGYWVFYENLDYPSTEHTACMNWFDSANDNIAAEDYDAAEDTYTTTLSWASFWDKERVPDFSCTFSSQSNTFSVARMRGQIPTVISCQANTSVSIKLNIHQLGSYTAPLAWELRTLDSIGTRVDRGTVWVDDETETITFTPSVTGTYVLALSAELNAFSITESNAPIAFYAGKRMGFLSNTTPLYVNVPSGVTSFTITAQSQGTAEHVKVSIYSPSNVLVEEEQTSSTNTTQVITVNVGTYGSGAWKIVTGQAGTEHFEDFYLTVGPEIPPFFSLDDDHLFYSQAVGLWYFDEDSGSTALDSAYNDNSGTLTNMDTSTCWVDGKVGSALQFDGVDDYVDCGTDSSLSFADEEAWSFEAWLYIEDGDGNWNAFTGSGSSSSEKFLMIHYSSSIYFTDENGNYSSSNIGFELDEWQHIAVTVDTSGNMRYYLNGVYKSTVTPASTAMDFYKIGKGVDGSYPRKFTGIIDEVRIYDKTLSADEISEDYSEGL